MIKYRIIHKLLLFSAAAEGHIDCVQFLLEQCGVPNDPKDRWGNMPIDEAETFGHERIVEYLQAWQERIQNDANKKNGTTTGSYENKDDLLIRSSSSDSLYDKSDTSSPIPPIEGQDKII